jgi:hypothetical protein
VEIYADYYLTTNYELFGMVLLTLWSQFEMVFVGTYDDDFDLFLAQIY